jgi:hypothetical protein
MSANVAIAQDTANPYSEADLRYNAANLNQIIAASNRNSGNGLQAQYYSSDGGTSWKQSNLPAVTGDQFQGDPAVDWTSDGTAWALTLGVNLGATSSTVVVRCFKSTNGGKDWTFDSVVSGTQTGTDKPSLWVDHSPGSPHRDTMYAIWHTSTISFVSVRNGPTGGWSAPLQITGTETTGTSDGSDIKTNANGDVFAFWPSSGNQKLFVAKSTDAGASFGALTSSPVQIGSTFGSFTIKIPAQASRLAAGGGTIGTLIAISGGAYRAGAEDLVFACWHDLAGGTGCNVPSNAPGTSTTSACKTRVWFTRSTDGGQTWQSPVKINDQAGLNDQFFPRLAVDEGTGNLMIVYYDTVNDPNRVQTDVWMQFSTDRGVNWSPAIRVTTQPTNEATGAQDNSQEFGDYIGLSGVYGRYFACWTDRRGGGNEQIFGAPLGVPSIEFALNKATFGQDEVSLHSSWPSAFWLDVNGFTNESLGFNHIGDLNNPPNPAPTITLAINQATNPSLSPTQIGQIGAHLPTVTFGPAPILAPDPTLTAELQQFMYPYTVAFPDQQAFGSLNPHQAAILTLTASLTVGSTTVRTTAFLELTKGEDPFFYDLDPSRPTVYPSWLSYDLRFFTATPSQSHQWFSVGNPTGPGDANRYIQAVIDNLNTPSQITNGDTFDGLQQSEDLSKLEFLQTNSSSHELVFNFAVARVRIQAATAVTLDPVRVFFRLFQAASTASTFTEVGTGQGTYRWGSNGTPNHKIALLGVQPDQQGHQAYVTIPCFAAPRVNWPNPADMTTQTDPKNARTVTTVAGGEVDTFFGCWLDLNQPGQTFLPNAPPANQAQWDGPWTGAKSVSGLINASPHQCLIAEIRYDDTPIPNGANSSTSDKLAQRNIAWIDGPNPGTVQSRVMAHPFEVAATSAQANEPDELVIDWGNTPKGSTAEIYLPAVSAVEVSGLAQRRYAVHELSVFDSHTVECPAHGITYIPLPAGIGRYAGLISVTLPPGIKRGDRYDILARQLTTKQTAIRIPPPEQPAITAAVSASAELTRVRWRQVNGAFQFALVIKVREEVLYPEERLLAWLRWRIGETDPADRWYDVLRQYELVVAGRVRGFGGDPGKIPPSQYGDVPGHPHGQVRHPGLPEPWERDRYFTGKVIGISYDRFGDFTAFTLLTEEGHERTFRGREPGVEALVNRAWLERFTITVTADAGSDWPESVTLRSARRLPRE